MEKLKNNLEKKCDFEVKEGSIEINYICSYKDKCDNQKRYRGNDKIYCERRLRE